MFSTSSIQQPSRRELRSFGFILTAGFLVIALWPLLYRGGGPRLWAVVLSVIFAAAAVLVPGKLRPVRRVWMAAGHILGRINTGLILGAVYYGMLTPVRLWMKVSGQDPMNRSLDRNCRSYRSLRKARPPSHMKNQF